MTLLLGATPSSVTSCLKQSAPLHCDLALSGLPWAWDSGRSPDLSVAIAEIKSQARPYILADPSSPPTDCTTLTKAFSINHP